MPGQRDRPRPPSEPHSRDSPQHEADDGPQYDRVPARNHDRGYDEREEHGDRYREDDLPLDYGEGEPRRQPQPRPRDQSPPPRPRSRSRGRDYSRERPRGGQQDRRSPSRRRDRRSPSRRRDQTERRPHRPYSAERGQGRDPRTRRSRSPGTERAPRPQTPQPLAHPPLPQTRGTGYTVIDHRTGRAHVFRPEYGQSRRSYTDLTKEYYASDVVSVRLCDFSSDVQAKVSQSFTPSSQGMINVKHNVPFIFKRVERDYGVGWVAHGFGGRGLKRAHWISRSEHAKYLGLASEDDRYGFEGNGSPHQQMKVRRAPGAERLEKISHVFAGELVKVTFPRKPYYWGRLRLRDFHRLQCLSDFLTASPGSSAANVDDVPSTMGFDISALKELRTADDSLDEDMKAGLAYLDDLHKPKSSDDDTDADARPPRAQAAPDDRSPPRTGRPVATDVRSTAPQYQPRQPPTRTTNAPRDPRPQLPTGPRLKRSRDGDDFPAQNTTRRRRD